MIKSISLLFTGLVLFSCNPNKLDNKSYENQQTTKKEEPISEKEFPEDDVTKNLAFVKLIDYSYQDADDYGKSSEKRIFSIKGKTNLPEKTIIKINIGGYVPSTQEEDANDTYGNAVVTNNTFEISLKPWNIPQTVSFRVFKDDQPSQVLEIIGQNGDKMKVAIDNKGEYPSICFFQEKVYINKQLINRFKGSETPKYTFHTAKDFTHPSEKVLANFVNAWKKENWSDMLEYTEKSQNLTSENLEDMFGFIKVVGFEILNKKKNSEEFVKEWYSIEYKVIYIPPVSNKGIQNQTIIANVVNDNGQWGINARSARIRPNR